MCRFQWTRSQRTFRSSRRLCRSILSSPFTHATQPWLQLDKVDREPSFRRTPIDAGALLARQRRHQHPRKCLCCTCKFGNIVSAVSSYFNSHTLRLIGRLDDMNWSAFLFLLHCGNCHHIQTHRIIVFKYFSSSTVKIWLNWTFKVLL